MREVSLYTLWDAIKELFKSIWEYILEDDRKMKKLEREHIVREQAKASYPVDDPDEDELLGI